MKEKGNREDHPEKILLLPWKRVKSPGEKTVRKRKEGGREHTLRKNTLMRAARALLWGMLLFIFVRGLIYTFRPDTVTEARQLIDEFNRELETSKKLDSEISAYAQNFAREYLTYAARGETDYKARLKAYMGNAASLSSLEPAANSATAVYVQAYRMEQYAAHQWDVYVLAEVEYRGGSREASEQTEAVRTESARTCLKVPVYEKDGYMIVEELPVLVNDDILLQDFTRPEYTGTSLAEREAKEVSASVTNFLKAYYGQDKTVIDYYLSQTAEKDRFTGLSGRYQFDRINSLKCYREEGQPYIICIAEFRVTDPMNGTGLLQRLNLKVLQADGRYYIQSMDTRTGNLDVGP